MLINDFYKVCSHKEIEPSIYNVTLELNAAHPIFDGHFPEKPIVPGVCLTQMATEITEQLIDKKLKLKQADSIKFTAMIMPDTHGVIEARAIVKEREQDEVILDLSFYSDTLVFYKIKAQYNIE